MTIVVHDAEVAVEANAGLGEGPVWDPTASCLYFVDILLGRVHRSHLAGEPLETFEVDQPVGAIALTERGDLVLAVRDGFARLDLTTRRVELIADVETDRPDQRMNDGKCDPAGRFWAGTMALDEHVEAGGLYRLGADLRVARMLSGVTISNGIDWTADGRTMFYIDSPTRRIDCFDFDVAEGTITNRRPFVQIPVEHGMPDGLTLDAEGGVWVALWGGGAVHRYLRDGSIDAIVRVPTPHPTSCIFGGRDLHHLYITSASIKLSPHERAVHPLAGAVFRCDVGVSGREPRRFRG